MTPPNASRVYSDEDAQEILRLAGAFPSTHDRYSEDDLVRAGAEVGVSKNSILQAIELFLAKQSEAEDRQEFDRSQNHEIFTHVIIGLAVGVMLYLVGDWGMSIAGLVGGTMVVMRTVIRRALAPTSSYEADFHQWRLGRELHAELNKGDIGVALMLAKVGDRQSVLASELTDAVRMLQDATKEDAQTTLEKFERTFPDIRIER